MSLINLIWDADLHNTQVIAIITKAFFSDAGPAAYDRWGISQELYSGSSEHSLTSVQVP